MKKTKLPQPPPAYDVGDQSQLRRLLEVAIANCLQAGEDIRLPIGRGVILRDANGDAWRVTVSTGGALTTTSVPQS